MPPTPAAETKTKAVRKPANPYVITPFDIATFRDGKTETVKGWKIKFAAKRGESADEVLVPEANLTHELLASVVASRNGGAAS